MNSVRLECGNCLQDNVVSATHSRLSFYCAFCGATTRLFSFPALLQVFQGHAGEALQVEDESSCFFHPARRAVVPCDGCGRFLCALCDIEMNGRHLCSSCIETGVQHDTLPQLRREYIRYDRIALTMAILPLLFFYITFFTAPIALFIVLWYWKKPLSILPRWRWRFVVAGLLAGLEIAGWATVLSMIFI